MTDPVDPLYRDAVALVTRKHFGSAGMLMREFAMSQGRALALLGGMRAAGVVGDPDEDGRWWSLVETGLTRAAKKIAVDEMARRLTSAAIAYDRRTWRRRHHALVRLAMARTVD